MRILVLAPRCPWPPTDGGRIAMARLAESLAKAGAEVRVLSLNPRRHRVEGARAPLPIELVDVDTSRVVAPAMRTLTMRTPFVVSRFVSRAFRAALRRTLRDFDPDIVQVESPFLLPYLRDIRAASHACVVLRSLNVEFRIWEGLAANETRALRRFAMRRVARSLREYEVRTLNAVDAIVPITRDDAEEFRALGCRKPIHVAPCGVALSDAADVVAQRGAVGFIGSLDYRPNQEAAEWIARELWPRVAPRADFARLSIGGSGMAEWLRERLRGDRIDLLGRIDDARTFVLSQSVILAPVFAGGGMRIKVLEAMALGRAVVATPLGAGGIDVDDGRDIVLARDIDAFADAVIGLLEDPFRATRIGVAARATVATRYDDATIGRGVLGFYRSL